MNDLDCLAVDLFSAEVFYNNRVLLTIDLKLSPFERPKGLLYKIIYSIVLKTIV